MRRLSAERCGASASRRRSPVRVTGARPAGGATCPSRTAQVDPGTPQDPPSIPLPGAGGLSWRSRIKLTHPLFLTHSATAATLRYFSLQQRVRLAFHPCSPLFAFWGVAKTLCSCFLSSYKDLSPNGVG